MAVIDPEVGVLLERLAELGHRPCEELGLARTRRGIDAATWMQTPDLAVALVRDLLVDGSAGRLQARLFHPEPGRTLPVVVYLHGGGWVAGGLRISDSPCRELALASGCAVVAVDYRLAPETQFPGGLQDCIAAVTWIAAHGDELGVDASRLALVGSSAGGNLAAATALALRGTATAVSRLLLFYPVLTAPPLNTFDSWRDNGDGFFISAADLCWYWSHYVDPGRDVPEGLSAAPLLEGDLSGLPPTVVATAELDPLRDEGRAYVDRLRAAGVEAELSELSGMVHGFSWMTGVLGRARERVGHLYRELGDQLRA